jgi:hypothetical protein
MAYLFEEYTTVWQAAQVKTALPWKGEEQITANSLWHPTKQYGTMLPAA